MRAFTMGAEPRDIPVRLPLLLDPGEQPSVYTLRRLYDLRIRLEREEASGYWDGWDEALGRQWLLDVRDKIHDCEMALVSRIHRLEEAR